MQRWIGLGMLAFTLLITGCAANGGYGRNYRNGRDYRYNRDYRSDRDYRYDRDRHRDHDRRRHDSDWDRRDDRDNWR